MKIPHAAEPRPDTGLYNAKLGTWLFLAFNAMFFASLFSAYVLLRFADAANWPEPGSSLWVEAGLAQTAFMLLAAAAAAQAWLALSAGPVARARGMLAAAMLCGAGFLAALGAGYRELALRGDLPRESAYHGIYFAITALIGLQVLGAICVTAYLIGPGGLRRSQAPLRFMNWVECSGLYWQFLALVWVAAFVVFHLF